MKVVDLFCGCGGMSLGFQKESYDIMAAFDFWDKSIENYKKNFTHPVICQDLSLRDESVNLVSQYKPEMIIGGPPCQDFSVAGKRDSNTERANLTYDFAYIVNSIQPDWFVMENVDRIRKSYILKDIVNDFQINGYGLTSVILDASLCGVPQKRKRFFLIGEKNGTNNALIPFFQKKLADSPMTIEDYLGSSLGLEYYYRHPRSYLRRGIFSIYEPSPTVRGMNRPLPPNYKVHENDAFKGDLSVIRPLTTVERSYLQTFPKNYIWSGNKTNLEQMIGNAVPVNLASFVGRVIKDYKSSKPIKDNHVNFVLCEATLKK